jgi:hypothetical protein
MLRPLPGGSRSSTGPRFLAEDQRRSPGAIAGHALLLVPEADGAEALDTQDVLGSMPQGALAVRAGAKAAETQAGLNFHQHQRARSGLHAHPFSE